MGVGWTWTLRCLKRHCVRDAHSTRPRSFVHCGLRYFIYLRFGTLGAYIQFIQSAEFIDLENLYIESLSWTSTPFSLSLSTLKAVLLSNIKMLVNFGCTSCSLFNAVHGKSAISSVFLSSINIFAGDRRRLFNYRLLFTARFMPRRRLQ